MSKSANKHLFEYCKEGKTQFLLDALHDVDATIVVDERGNSLLSVALKNGHWHTAEKLIEHDYLCKVEDMILISACQYRKDNPQGIKIALEINPNVDAQNQQARTALMTACLLGHFRKAKELIDYSANCELYDNQGDNALIDAIRTKNIKVVELILTQNVDVNYANNEGDTALHIAIKQKAPLESIIVLLLEAGGNPEITDSNEKSVWLMAKQKNTKIARLIERHLNNINQIELPFFNTSRSSEPEDKGDEVSPLSEETQTNEEINTEVEQESDGSELLEEALNEVREDRIEPTMQLDEIPSSQDGSTASPANTQTKNIFRFKTERKPPSNTQEWFHAAKNGNLGGLNRMIMAGVDINCVDVKGCSALIRACGHSRRAVVSYLLQQNADIELRSENGSTALSSSVIGNCRRVAGLLLERGANPNGLGPSNYSYVIIAAAQWNDAMLSILYRNKADIFALDKFQQNLIHTIALGAEHNHNINTAKSSIQFLMDHGVDVNAQDANGNTAMMVFCGAHTGQYQVEDRDIASIVHYLLKNGAAPAITNIAGESAIDATRLHRLQQTKGVLMNALSWNN